MQSSTCFGGLCAKVTVIRMTLQVKENYRKYSRLGRCLGHSSHVIQLDWTTDCQHLRSNSADHEVVLFAILLVVDRYLDPDI